MNASSLALPASAAATPAANASAPAATAAQSTDFVLMLGQMLGGAAAQNAAGTPKTALPKSAANSASESTDATDAAAAMAMLSVVPMMPWSNPQNLTAAAEAAADAINSLDLMSLTAGGKRSDATARDAQLLASLTDALKTDDAGTSIPASLSASQSLDVAQGLRAVTAGDALNTRALHQPVGSSAWADELGTRMTLMADRGQHSASLRLSPEHLGPLEVRIAVRDDQASVWFGAAHADTRAAIEQALPRLRELFAAQGMSLADAGVFQQAPKEQPQLSSTASSPAEVASEAQAIAQVGPIRLGLVDAYA